MEHRLPHADELLHHAGALRAMARALIGNRSEVEDLVQDTMVLALESPPEPREGIGAWLRGVLRKKIHHRQRSEAARVQRERFHARTEALPPTVDLVTRRAQLGVLVDEVLRLKEPYQTVLYLRFFEDKTPGEIARELEVPAGTIASQVSRGLDLLRTRLDQRAGGNRDAWVGALLPWFAGETTKTGALSGGAWMAGGAKLVGSAAVLGSLLFYVANQESTPLESVALLPDAAPAARSMRVAGKTEEPRPRDTRETISVVEPTGASVAGDSTLVLDSPPPSTIQDVPPTEVPAVEPPPTPVPQESFVHGERLLSCNRIQRHVELELSSEADRSMDTPMHIEGDTLWVNMDWSMRSDLNFTDLYPSTRVGPFEPFERDLIAEWTLETPALTSFSTKPESKTLPGRSPFEQRVVRFAKHGIEDRYVASFRTPRATDDSRWLTGLRADLDLQAFRPPQGLLPGGQWRVPIDALWSALLPGGDLKVRYEQEGTDPWIVPNQTDAMTEHPPAPHTTEFMLLTGFAPEPKGEVGKRLPFRIQVHGDVSMPTLEGHRPGILGTAAAEGELQLRIDLEGDGTWDLQNDRLESLDLGGELLYTLTGPFTRELNPPLSAVKGRANLQLDFHCVDHPRSGDGEARLEGQ